MRNILCCLCHTLLARNSFCVHRAGVTLIALLALASDTLQGTSRMAAPKPFSDYHDALKEIATERLAGFPEAERLRALQPSETRAV